MKRTVVSLALIAAACTGVDDDPAARGIVTSVDSSGTFPVVDNAGQPPLWTVDLTGVVGTAATGEEPAPDEFGRVSSVTTGPGDTVWVADQQTSRIKAFGPDGTLALEVGREGQGPGEYLSIYSIAWVGPRLLVLDLGNGRIAELSGAGDWLRTRGAPGSVSGPPSRLRLYPVSPTIAVQWSLEIVDGEARRVWLEQGPDGPGRSWPQLTLDLPQPTTVVCRRADGGISFFTIPFSGQLLNGPAREGQSYLAWSASYQFALVDPKGDTLMLVKREWPTLPLSDEQWEEETAEFTAFREDWPGAECEPRSMPRPQVRAALRNLLVDTENRVWVEASVEGGTVWEVFTSDGRLIGAVDGFDYDASVAPSIVGDRIAWVRADSLGVQHVLWGKIATGVSF